MAILHSENASSHQKRIMSSLIKILSCPERPETERMIEMGCRGIRHADFKKILIDPLPFTKIDIERHQFLSKSLLTEFWTDTEVKELGLFPDLAKAEET